MFPIVSGVAQNQVSGPAAVTDVYSEDDVGAGASGVGNSRFTKTIGASVTQNQGLLDPIIVAAGNTLTVGVNSAFTGTAASYAWSISTIDNSQGLVISYSSSATTADWNPTFAISAGGGPGMVGLFSLALAVTNAGGTTTRTWAPILITIM